MRYLLDTNTLITHNTKEFNRVPGLKVENWIDQDKSTGHGKPHR